MAQRYRSVEAPPIQPPLVSLLNTINAPVAEHRFTEGIAWLPEWVDDGHAIAINPDTGALASREASITDPIPAELKADPFVLWAGEKSSTLGNMGRDYVGRVRRKLEATRSHQAAAELWDGAVGLANSHAQNPFTAITSDRLSAVATPETTLVGWADMEMALSQALSGTRGMIHCTPNMLYTAVAQLGVRLNGSTWVTPMGNIVVCDSGYSGNGPGAGGENDADGSSQWIMGTGMVSAILGPLDVKPRGIADREAIDIDDNDVIVLGQQPIVFQWDTNIHLAMELNVGLPADIGGAS